MQQSILIIGGKYRKKKINFPNLPDLRPTANRIRETLFNWLMHDIRDAECLDGYSGSGALGFEAISRGAQSVTLIENNFKIYQSLQKTAATFHNENIKLINDDFETFLQTTHKTFNIVFLDPPFGQPFPDNCLKLLENKPVLAPTGLLYIEYHTPIELNPDRWETLKIKRAGQVTYALYKKLKISP